MSLLPSATYSAPGAPLYGGGGGGGGSGSFSTINVSTIDIQPNGDINWDGSVNFQGTNGGYLSLLSTIGGGAGNGIELTGPSPTAASTINMYVGADGKAYLTTTTPNSALNMPGVNIAGTSTITTGNLTLSSINGAAYQPISVAAVAAQNSPVYAPPGGGNSAAIYTITATAGHSYRVEMPVKIQGWSSINGLSNNYVPGASDVIYISPLGNVTGSPAPVFTTVPMSVVSTMNNDYEATVACSFRVSANGSTAIFANTIGANYSTSVEVGNGPMYVWDLGNI
jgi:hypothetical protein